MNSGPLLFLGVLFALASSFWGLILAPQLQIGQQQQRTVDALTGQQYPVPRIGLAEHGAQVYRANGCMECHTQQVRPPDLGSDIARGWGKRRSVAQDYLRADPVMLGTLRLGPDLANIGVRQTNSVWHLTHLYNPKSTSPGSLMPPYRYLFVKRKLAVEQTPSPEALPPGVVEAGYEVVPRTEAKALTAYLLSLRADTSLLESPIPLPPTNAVPAAVTDTNAVAASATNAVTNVPVIVPAP